MNGDDRRLAEISRARLDGDLLAAKTLDTETRVSNLERRRVVAPDGFSHIGRAIHTVYFTAGTLIAWWRLGETAAFPVANNTPDFLLDESPNHHNLTALNYSEAGTPFTTDLPVHVTPGALAPGNADDGGWKSSLAFGGSVSHITLGFAASSLTMEPTLTAVGQSWSFSCWLRPTQTASSVAYPVVSSHQRSFGVGNGGSVLRMNPITGVISYNTGQYNSTTEFNWTSSFGLDPAFWHHFAVTITRLGADNYRRRIYVNTNVQYDQTGPQALIANAAGVGGLPLSVFWGMSNDIWTIGGPSMADEIAMWSSELTQENVDDLWNARVLADGDVWTTATIDPITDIADGSIGTVKLADDSITSAKIADGTIVDADVSPTADIQTTKLAHPGGTTTFLRGDGAWAVPAGGGTTTRKQLRAFWAGWLPQIDGYGLTWRVPFNSDGTSMTFVIARAYARIDIPHTIAVTAFRIESSPGGDSAFVPTTVTTDLQIFPNHYEVEDTVISSTVHSGDLLRLVYTAVGADTNYEVELLGSE